MPGLAVFKLALALTAMFALGKEVLARRRSPDARRILVTCAVLSAVAYFAPAFERDGFVHRWEMFHYYLGAKYQPELGYERLYTCVVAVDVADNVPGARTRHVRDLRNDALTTGDALLRSSPVCESTFSAARWSAFREDVRAFRRQSGSRRFWQSMSKDHGYNPPPHWTAVGGSLARLAPPTPRFLALLASLDVLLMAGAVALLAWGFGARVASVAVIFWGTQAASDFAWTGGGYLRQDWLFCAVLALACLRQKRPFSGGAALAAAALLRLFPALLVTGVVVGAARGLIANGQLSQSTRRICAGFATAAVLLVTLTLLAVPPSSYAEFWRHIQLRHSGIITNHMGLRTLFAFSPEARLSGLVDPALLDPSLPWVHARAARLASLGLAYRAAAAGVAALVLFTVARTRSAWLATALSLPLVVAVAEPSCYYYSMWLLAVPLARARPSVGVTLLGVAAAGQLVTLRFEAPDARYFALALLYVASALVLLCSFTDTPWARFHHFRAQRARRATARGELVGAAFFTRRSRS